jgi:hypothetical protein
MRVFEGGEKAQGELPWPMVLRAVASGNITENQRWNFEKEESGPLSAWAAAALPSLLREEERRAMAGNTK